MKIRGMKGLKLALTAFLFLFIFPFVVSAGSGTMGLTGNADFKVGDEVEVTMYIDDVVANENGVVSAEANLEFDSSYLEYLSGVGVTSPYVFQINPSYNYKIVGFDISLKNGIKKRTNVFTFRFRALKAGSTTIGFTNPKLCETTSKFVPKVVSHKISIKASSGGSVKPSLSNNASLTSLSIVDYPIMFDKNNLFYSVTVSNLTSKLDIKAIPEDVSAKVQILNNSLIEGSTTKVQVKVTSESGNSKTYTISATRPKKGVPNLSSDNYLKSISVSAGVLNPAFSKQETVYRVDVDADVTSIKIDVEAPAGASVKVEEVDSLVVGENKFKYFVTAEDGSTREYNVIVTRRSETEEQPLSAEVVKPYLEDIKIENGKLNTKFDKDVFEYTYSKRDGFKIDAIAFADEDEVEVKEKNDIISIHVKNPNGYESVYTLRPEKTDNIPFVTIGILWLLIIGAVVIYEHKKKQKHVLKAKN